MNPLSQPVRCHSGVTSVSAVLSLLLALCGYLAAGCGSAGTDVHLNLNDAGIDAIDGGAEGFVEHSCEDTLRAFTLADEYEKDL